MQNSPSAPVAALPPPRASIPVVTNATAASDAELLEAAAHFLEAPHDTLAFERCGGGVNNKVYRVVDTSTGVQHILRVYNNGFNDARVAYEHEVLRQLAERAASLPFEIPTLVTALPASGRGTSARLASGAHACMFRTIRGGAAPLSAARAIGAATAQLVDAMATIVVPPELGSPNPLYRNPWEAHHTVTRDAFLALVASDPAFVSVRSDMDFLVREIERAEVLISEILASGDLPEQQLHADLHFDNVLCDGDVVTGVLDLEFSAFDWRAMEAGVGLSKFCGLTNPEPHVRAFVEGYGSAGGRLTRREIELMPDLIILRILSNVIYFGGRALAGEDTVEPLSGRAHIYAARIRWLHDNRAWLVGVLDTLVAPSTA